MERRIVALPDFVVTDQVNDDVRIKKEKLTSPVHDSSVSTAPADFDPLHPTFIRRTVIHEQA